jgi:hypothetical protein
VIELRLKTFLESLPAEELQRVDGKVELGDVAAVLGFRSPAT